MSATPGLKRCVALYKMNRHGPSLEQMRLAYEELHGCSIRRPQSTCEVRKEFLAVALDVLASAIESGTVETEGLDESAAPKADAREGS